MATTTRIDLTVTLAALLAAPCPDGPRSGPDGVDPLLRKVWSIARDAEERPEGTVARLTALGDAAIPALFAAWTGREAQLLEEDGGAPAGTAPERREAARTAFQRALAAASTAERREFLRYCVEVADSTDDARLDVVYLLGEIGDAGDLDLLARGCSRFSAPALASPLVRGALRLHLGRILRRDPGAFEELARGAPSWPPAARPLLVEAAGDAGSPAAARFLLRLARDPGTRVAALRAVVGLEAALDEETRAAVVLELRRALESSDVALRRVAVAGLRDLDDVDSLELLVPCTEDPDPKTRALADDALHALSGRARPPGQSWAVWWQAEKDWWEQEGAGVLADLRSGTAPEMLASLRVLSGKRYFFDRFQPGLRDALQSPEAVVRRMVVAVLGRVGSVPACRLLLRGLEDPDPEVRSLAHAELRRATGLDLPPDPQAWVRGGQ